MPEGTDRGRGAGASSGAPAPSARDIPATGDPAIAAGARPLRLARLVLAAAWLALFAPQLFARRTFVLGDARVYRPFAEYSRERWLERHERTFWNPFVMTGVAASASLADMRPQYLPDLALDVFERVRPGRWVPLAAPLVAHLAGMWALAALAWALWRLPAAALVWAGLSWGLSPLLLIPLAFGHTAYFAALSLAPGMLLAVHRMAAAHVRGAPGAVAGWVLALGGIAGLQALTGHPQVVAYSGALALAFAIERAVRARRAPIAVVAALGLAWGAAIATAVWLPALRYGEHSVRGGAGVALERVRSMSIAWHELASFAFPWIVGGSGDTYWGGLWKTTDYPRFFGTLVVLFAALAVFGRRRGARDGVTFLAGVTLAAVLFALGPRLGPVYSALRAVFPPMSRFWVASMALVVAVPAVALLSAAGVANTLGAPSAPPRTRPSRAPWIALAALLCLGLVLLTVGGSAYAALAHALRVDLEPGTGLRAARAAGLDLAARALLLAVALVLCARWRTLRWTPAALVALLALDLIVVSAPTLRRASAPESAMTSRPEPLLARFGREDHTARVLSARVQDVSGWQVAGLTLQPEMRTNDWVRWQARAYGGEHGTPSADYEEVAFLESTEALRALGVVYVSSPPDVRQDSSAFEVVARAPDETVYRLRQALGRAYTVSRVRALPSEVEVARAMIAGAFRADSVAYTLDAAAAGDYPGSAGARVRWVRDEPDDLTLEVTCDAPAFVVIADAWMPGWEPESHVSPEHIWRVDHSLRGVAVPAGRHTLRMRYRPESWGIGILFTRVAGGLWLVAAIAWLVWSLVFRPRSV